MLQDLGTRQCGWRSYPFRYLGSHAPGQPAPSRVRLGIIAPSCLASWNYPRMAGSRVASSPEIPSSCVRVSPGHGVRSRQCASSGSSFRPDGRNMWAYLPQNKRRILLNLPFWRSCLCSQRQHQIAKMCVSPPYRQSRRLRRDSPICRGRVLRLIQLIFRLGRIVCSRF